MVNQEAEKEIHTVTSSGLEIISQSLPQHDGRGEWTPENRLLAMCAPPHRHRGMGEGEMGIENHDMNYKLRMY